METPTEKKFVVIMEGSEFYRKTAGQEYHGQIIELWEVPDTRPIERQVLVRWSTEEGQLGISYNLDDFIDYVEDGTFVPVDFE